MRKILPGIQDANLIFKPHFFVFPNCVGGPNRARLFRRGKRQDPFRLSYAARVGIQRELRLHYLVVKRVGIYGGRDPTNPPDG